MAAEGDVIPMGLIENEWGGSMIEAWVPELNAATGETYCTERNTRTGRTPGKLFNSMIMYGALFSTATFARGCH
jgi:hypothetical protein